MSTPTRTRGQVNDVPLDEAYFVWLYSQVGSVKNRNRSKTYWNLLRFMYKKEFTWSDIEKDANRAQDGKDLRREFVRQTGYVVDEGDLMLEGCSFLELLVGLSWALAFEGEGEPAYWFWDLVRNLGLCECTDATSLDEAVLDHILNKVINRDYSPNGAGGLFPLQHPDKDQREVELWYQANAYLLERL